MRFLEKLKTVGEQQTPNLLVGETVLTHTGEVNQYVGTVVRVTYDAIWLHPAAWIADTGRIHEAIRDGFSNEAEIEPLGPAVVRLPIDTPLMTWPHPVPTEAQ